VDGHDGGGRHNYRDRGNAGGDAVLTVAGLPNADKNVGQFEGSGDKSWQKVSRCESCALWRCYRFRPLQGQGSLEKGSERMAGTMEI
jgi:hypothetical protein